MEKVIIAGASGFVGRALTRALLKRGVIVYGIGRNAEKMSEFEQEPNFHMILLDFAEYDQISTHVNDKIDVFFYLAYQGVWGEEKRDYKIQLENTLASCVAMEQAILIKCKKFVFGGSADEFETYRSIDISGTFKASSANIYGAAKLAGETICKTMAYYNDVEFNAALMTLIYGEGNKSKTLVNVLLWDLINGRRPKLVQGDFLYDIVYIEEAVSALICIGEKGKNMSSYYVGHKDISTFEQLVVRIRDIINPDIELGFGEYTNTNTGTDYSKIDREKLFRETECCYDCDFNEGIKKTAFWIQENFDE